MKDISMSTSDCHPSEIPVVKGRCFLNLIREFSFDFVSQAYPSSSGVLVLTSPKIILSKRSFLKLLLLTVIREMIREGNHHVNPALTSLTRRRLLKTREKPGMK